MKVVWLCHFVNQEMKDYFKTPDVKELAPWIDNLIVLFRAQKGIKLYIVSPNVFTNMDHHTVINGINYHFYKHIPIPGYIKLFNKAHSFLRLESITNFSFTKYKIQKIIDSIQPDLIHLHGAENPYYAAGFLRVADYYPNIVTIQGFIRQSIDTGFYVKKRRIIEEQILIKTKHIGVRTREMSQIAKSLNPHAKLHFHNYPTKVPSITKGNIGGVEPIDCIFFARVCKDKGIEDLLEAISIVKKKLANISLAVIGSAGAKYMLYLKNLCIKLHIDNNVNFIGFLPTQEDIYKYAIKAKICVLPTYHDIIPGTVIESMMMKLPVVAYAVGGIPELNEVDETVVLVSPKNIKKLAEKIINLLNDVKARNLMVETAYTYAKERFDNSRIIPDIMQAYRIILDR